MNCGRSVLALDIDKFFIFTVTILISQQVALAS